MSTPGTAFGRKYPRNDWEGDDFVPGSGGAYVSCVDTAAGRMVAWATNGKVDKDGTVYRSAVSPHDPNGITLPQAQQAVHSVTSRMLFTPRSWGRMNVAAHLLAGRGLMVTGVYDVLPRWARYQAFGAFTHEMFVTHISSASGMRTWDPLNPDTTGYGRWLPPAIVWPFIESGAYSDGGYQVAYVPLEPL